MLYKIGRVVFRKMLSNELLALIVQNPGITVQELMRQQTLYGANGVQNKVKGRVIWEELSRLYQRGLIEIREYDARPRIVRKRTGEYVEQVNVRARFYPTERAKMLFKQ